MENQPIFVEIFVKKHLQVENKLINFIFKDAKPESELT